jgi:hypothetical protein
MSIGFLVQPQNQGRRFISGLTSKPLERFLIGLSLKTDVDGLWVVWPQNHSGGLASKLVATVFGGLALKPAATIFSGLASKPVMTVFPSLASKLMATVSPSLASKPVVCFLIEPQN